MANAREWFEGARPRTLSASVSPVIVGAALAWSAPPGPAAPPPDWPAGLAACLLCLVVGAGFQIGSNYANDYSDGIRGTDAERVGPMRLVGSGAARPRTVKRAAWACFAVACLAGLILVAGLIRAWTRGWGDQGWAGLTGDPASLTTVIVAGAVLILIGLACLVAAWFYTGGRRPYGYHGWGEVFVFVFFGLVATIGTAFLVAGWRTPACAAAPVCAPALDGNLNWPAVLVAAVVMGSYACAILVANNLRDIATDQASGKITLPVRLGETGARWLYLALILTAAVGVGIVAWLTTAWALSAWAGLAVVSPGVRQVAGGASGRALIAVLTRTGLAELVTAAVLALALVLAPLIGGGHG